MIGSTVKVFLCISSSESLQLTISCTSSAWKALSIVHAQ